MPLSELKIGLPLAISYSLQNDIPIWITFLDIVLLNILLVFFIFYFLDKLHNIFMKINLYKKAFNRYVLGIRKKLDKIENHSRGKFAALLLFVASPLPGTGAWSGCLISWLLGMERKKSIWVISVGVLTTGALILLGTLGFFNLLN